MSGNILTFRIFKDRSGFTYLAALFAIIVIGIASSVVGKVWSTEATREKEAELVFRAQEIRKAVGRYYHESPGAKRYPASLEDLIKDARYLATKRHLRKLYTDPFTGKPDWETIKAPDNGIMGVKSRSEREPIKKKNFPDELVAFEGKSKYTEWEFIYVPTPPVKPPANKLP